MAPPDGSSWPNDLVDLLLLQGGYNAVVVQVGALLLGVAAGSVGTLAMLRKRALTGDALAHATLPGITIAFLLAPVVGVPPRSMGWLLLGASVFGVLGVLMIQFMGRVRRLSEDTALAIVLSSFFGLGFVILSYIQTLPTGNQAGLQHLVLGQAAAMRARDAVMMGGLALAALAALTLLFKEFRLVCFDREYGATKGWPVEMLDLALLMLVVVVTVVGLQAVGIVMIVALIVVPAATARLWSDRLGRVVVIAALVGGASGYVGSAISALHSRIATGGSIVLVAGFCFVVSLLIAPRRGIVASVIRTTALRARVGRDHVLRSMHEWLRRHEHEVVSGARAPLATVIPAGTGTIRARLQLALLRAGGVLRREGSDLILTERGAALARQVTRGHLLWEQYLLDYADLAPTHVHSPADLVEHSLSPDLIDELDAALTRRGRSLAEPHP